MAAESVKKGDHSRRTAAIKILNSPSEASREPVWPSGKAVGW